MLTMRKKTCIISITGCFDNVLLYLNFNIKFLLYLIRAKEVDYYARKNKKKASPPSPS